MKLFNEYRTQGFFVGLMSTLILGGILVLTGLYKGVAVDFPRHMLPWYLRFILSYGIFLMLIPVFWTSATIRLENHPVLRYHRAWTFVTGMLLLIGLTCLFVHCGMLILWAPITLR
jgi:hypothetical protein